MIIQDSQKVVSNISDSQEFSVTVDSARLFRMLSDFLYSNKELCVMHEISANALDAHKLVGKEDVPIQVHVPTALSPYLKIRDFGPGLSDGDVRRLLTTYGESGEYKRTSNDFLGSYGVGSKSPAAVTKTWDITSFYDGMETLYKVFVNERGIPVLTKMFEKEEASKSGLEVSIPIDPINHRKWIDLIPEVYKMYPVKPVLVGTSIKLKGFTYSYRNSDYGFINDKISSTTIAAITSNRLYYLDSNVLGKQIAKYNYISRLGIHLFFDTGELDLGLSRENIQYTKYTIEAIERKVNAVYDDLYRMFLEAVKDAVTDVQYKISVIEFLKLLDVHYAKSIVFSFIKQHGKFKILNGLDLDDYTFYADVYAISFYRHKTITSLRSKDRSNYFGGDGVVVKLDNSVTVKLNVISNKTLMIVKKDTKDTISRVKYLKSLGGQTRTFLIVDDIDESKLDPSIRPLIVNGSSLQKLKRDALKSEKTNVYRLSIKYQGSTITFSKIDTQFFDRVVELNKKLAHVFFTKANNSSSLEDVHNLSRVIGKMSDEYTFLAVRKGTQPPKGSVHILDIAKSTYAKSKLNIKMYSKYYAIHRNSAYMLQVLESMYAKTGSEVVQNTIDDIKNTLSYKSEVEAYSKCNIGFFKDWPTLVEVDDVMSQVFDKYPMLKYCTNMSSIEDAVDYINLIDRKGVDHGR